MQIFCIWITMPIRKQNTEERMHEKPRFERKKGSRHDIQL